ncbi:MAG TPA: Stp1/IreP family PP2C-type Ser/Thr phosphatase [Ignavibacteriaceae bacterium]|nr:Stp1/IreP family PP2C-type Ser/Thr phosphatase [Ignavibacteriaceae bacterium]
MASEVKLSIEYAGKTDIGLVRAENQDTFGKYPVGVMDLYSGKGQLFVIADGMGGHAGGKIASRLAVETIGKTFFNSENTKTSEALKNAIEYANKIIFWESENSDHNLAGMGTTCVVLALKENKAVIGHVGDSRIYKIEDNKITQLTEDHTQVNEMLKEGILSRREAENYPLKTVLARALGTDKEVKVDIIPELLLKIGQSFILCTDGLGKVSPDEILKIVSSGSSSEACEKLIKTANERGGNDNVTVQVVKIIPNQKEKTDIPGAIERKGNKSKILIFIAIIIVLIIAGILSMNSFPFLAKSKNNYSSTEEFEKTFKKSDLKASSAEANPEDDKSNTNDSGNLLSKEAANLFKTGRIEQAAEIYKQILKAQPMHLGALDGLNNIALYYFHKAEELRFKSKIKEALEYYLKMEELQPGNAKVIDLIKLCEYQIKISNPEPK